MPTGVFSGKNVNWDVRDWVLTFYGLNPSSPSVPVDSDLVTHAMAVSNPNRPILDVGIVAQDIWEFPKLCKDIFAFGLGILKRPSNLMRARGKEYLTYEFGLAPTISDLQTALDLVNAVEKRRQVLAALQRRGVSRTTRFGTSNGGKASKANPPSYQSATQTYTSFVTSFYGPNVSCQVSYNKRVECWVSTVYTLDDDSWLHHPDGGPLDQARAALALGPNQASQIWELMPWTWLINWFSNVGDVFNANQNSLGASCTEACVMKHTWIHISDMHITNNAGWTGTSLAQLAPTCDESKTRNVYLNPMPSLSFHLPFLDGGQLSILAALTDSKTWGRG